MSEYVDEWEYGHDLDDTNDNDIDGLEIWMNLTLNFLVWGRWQWNEVMMMNDYMYMRPVTDSAFAMLDK
jgi:hypothetical protein